MVTKHFYYFDSSDFYEILNKTVCFISYLVILISSYCHEHSFRVGYSGKRGKLQPLDVICFHHMDPRLVSVHRVQYDLKIYYIIHLINLITRILQSLFVKL